MNQLKYIAFCLFLLLACSSTEEKMYVPQNPTPSGQPIVDVPTINKSFLALGDSYTIGQSVPEKDRWSVLLNNLLSTQYQMTPHDIIAQTGWTTQELMQGIAKRNLTQQYDMVSLLIGVNNQYRGLSLEQYRTEFRELLKISANFAKNDYQRVMVLSIPDWGVSPAGQNADRAKIGREIDAFNGVAEEECKKVGVAFIDITSISRQNTDASMFASDGLHFSGKMHKLWAMKAQSTALGILKK